MPGGGAPGGAPGGGGSSGGGGSPGGGGSWPAPDSKVADPVVMSGHAAYTFDRLEDLFIPQPSSEGFSFQRTYYSRDEPWYGTNASLSYPGGTILADVAPPFGMSRASTSTTRSLRWTHNLFSFVDQTSNYATAWVVRPPNGNHEEFARCLGTDGGAGPCWAPNWNANTPGQTNRLQRTTAGFTYFQNDGKMYVYNEATADAGQFYITGLVSSNGAPIASVSYAQPYTGCPTLSASGLPYVHEVTLATGQVLTFDYGTVSGECVLSAIRNGATTLVSYDYASGGAGLLSSATTAEFVESFLYDGGFQVIRNGAVIVSHTQTGDAGASYSADPNGTFEYTGLSEATGKGPLSEAQDPCGAAATPLIRTATDTAARAGDGGDVSAGFTQTFMFNTGYAISRHTADLWSRTDSCTAPYSCSPGEIRWVKRAASSTGGFSDLGATCTTTYPGVPYGIKDKRDNWLITPQSYVTFDGGNVAFEVRAEWRGVPSVYDAGKAYPDPGSVGQNALESVEYTYAYGSGTQAVATEKRPSVISTDGGFALTTFVRDSSNQVTARYESGVTMQLDGTLLPRVIARFYSYASGKLTSESGPCVVADTSVSSCPSGSPLTEYAYYGAGGANGGRLNTVTRYTDSATLVTTYGAYTALGEPGSIVDENGVTTTFTYSGHNVTQRRVLGGDGGAAAEWNYTWDNEHLTSVAFPEGNYEAYCYRSGATADSSCSGTWTGKLQKVSKATSADGVTGWTEAVVYDYWADGTLKAETRYANDGGPVARFHQTYAADAHRRPTLNVTGASGAFAEPRGYDASDNVAAIGSPYNGAPAFCRSLGGSDATTGALSRLCAQMGYDRANRLRQLDLFADASSNTPIRACIDYDQRGNVSRVTTGCSGSDTCSTEASATTCGSSPGWSHDYLTDDFGNVVEVRLSGTDNGSGGRGVFRYEFDASGNPVKQQTEAQRSAATLRYIVFEYDRLGRKTKTKEYRGATPYTVLTWAFDDDSSVLADPPSSCGGGPLRTRGRLRAVRDASFTRWYQYDLEGRVTKEVRQFNGAGTDCAPNLHLEMEYSANGNLTALHYGDGRRAAYSFGTGARKDRASSISINYFPSDGGVEQRDLITNIEWEPYGSLRKYRIEPEGIWVDYEQGAAQTAPAARCQSGALSETIDQSERLRSLRVWSSAREIYRRTYTWRADQVERIDSCYLGGNDGGEYLSEVYSLDAGAGLGYDGLGRLVGAIGPTLAADGGTSVRKYTFTGGNVTSVARDSDTYTLTYDSSSANRRDWLTSFGTDSWNQLDLHHDRDGRVSTITGPVDSSGYPPLNQPSSTITLDYSGDSPVPGGDTVMRTVSVTGAGYYAWFYYAYDALGRRTEKNTPISHNTYFYDTGHQMLWSISTGTAIVDEYVWLDGRPVAAIRAALGFGTSLTHNPDGAGTCARDGDGVSCGIYAIVTDHIGKPVLSLDSAGRITGVGEYDPYGSINRVEMHEQTAHPYTKAASSTTFYTLQQKELGGLNVRFRAHFPMVDTEEDCSGTVRESVEVRSADEATLYETIGGHAKGDVWTNWWTGDAVSGQRVLKLGWGTGAGNCEPAYAYGGCGADAGNHTCPRASGEGWDYSGWVLREYEYGRYESGANPYFPPFRFPGHYWDAETDMNENWHRYYSPHLSQYLSLEPLLHPGAAAMQGDPNLPPPLRSAISRVMSGPGVLAMWAQGGQPTPTYSYALNQPINSTDPDGLAATQEQWCKENPATCKDMHLPPFDPSEDSCGPSPGGSPEAEGKLSHCLVVALIEIQYCLGRGGSHSECGLRGTVEYWKCVARQ